MVLHQLLRVRTLSPRDLLDGARTLVTMHLGGR